MPAIRSEIFLGSFVDPMWQSCGEQESLRIAFRVFICIAQRRVAIVTIIIIIITIIPRVKKKIIIKIITIVTQILWHRFYIMKRLLWNVVVCCSVTDW